MIAFRVKCTESVHRCEDIVIPTGTIVPYSGGKSSTLGDAGHSAMTIATSANRHKPRATADGKGATTIENPPKPTQTIGIACGDASFPTQTFRAFRRGRGAGRAGAPYGIRTAKSPPTRNGSRGFKPRGLGGYLVHILQLLLESLEFNLEDAHKVNRLFGLVWCQRVRGASLCQLRQFLDGFAESLNL